jgi:allantoinase
LNTAAVDLSIAGRLVVGEEPPFRGEVLIRGGKISELRRGAPVAGGAERRIDVGDAYLLPGAVDCHVHSSSHPGEGIAALTRSAAAGGVTTVIDMPYDAAAPVSSAELLAEKREIVTREALVDVALLATVRPGSGAADVARLVEAGAAGFKLSLFCTDPRRFPRIGDLQFLEVLAAIREAGSLALVHAENEEIIKPLIERARQRGDASPLAHCRSRPPVSETQAVLTALEYARQTGARLHLCHLSLPRSVDLAARYRAEGTSVSTETCPHYLFFSEDDMSTEGGRLKINPPLRIGSEVGGLTDRLLAGSIDVVASDHAPWPLVEKERPNIFDNHSGAPGVETLLSVLATAVSSAGGSPNDVARLTSSAPAEIFGLSSRKGSLERGKDGDVVALDFSSAFTLDEQRLHSNAGWSPYHGKVLRGRVLLAVSRGEVVYDGEKLVATAPRGRLLTAGAPASV